jgi:hypothetical protein
VTPGDIIMMQVLSMAMLPQLSGLALMLAGLSLFKVQEGACDRLRLSSPGTRSRRRVFRERPA